MGLGLLIGAIAGCGYIPRPVEGVPAGTPWEALPLRKWLAEERAEPIALSFCAPPDCTPGLVVGVVRLTGEAAKETQTVLDDPSALTRALRAAPKRQASEKGKPALTLVSAATLESGLYRGFTISLAPEAGGKKPAYGAALGTEADNALLVVLVIGEDEASVETTVRAVAERELRP